jgi:hypothetical protein
MPNGTGFRPARGIPVVHIPDYGTGNSAPRLAQLVKEAVYAVAD